MQSDNYRKHIYHKYENPQLGYKGDKQLLPVYANMHTILD